jgi:hypothetical protein
MPPPVVVEVRSQVLKSSRIAAPARAGAMCGVAAARVERHVTTISKATFATAARSRARPSLTATMYRF